MCHDSIPQRFVWGHLAQYFLLVAGDFFAGVLLGADFFFACPFAPLASVFGDSCSSSAFNFFGFASFLGNAGALKLCPSKAISVIRTAVYDCRCPPSFLYCFFRFSRNTRIFSPPPSS